MATIKQRPTSRCFPSVSDVNVSGWAGGAGSRPMWADLAVAVHPPQRPEPEPQSAYARQAPHSSADPQWRGGGRPPRDPLSNSPRGPSRRPPGAKQQPSGVDEARPHRPGEQGLRVRTWDPAAPRSQATVIPRGRSAEIMGHDGLAEPPVVRAGCFSQVPDVALCTPALCLLPV